MGSAGKILIVDDDREIRALMQQKLTREDFEVLEAVNGQEALKQLQQKDIDLIFLDIEMPLMNGFDVLDQVVQNNLDIPVIVITAYSSMNYAINAIRKGAYDILTKPFKYEDLKPLINRCLEEQRLKRIVSERDTTEKTASPYQLIGSSPVMLNIFKTIGAVARTDNTTTVLILGESGTGKELVSRQIHLWGTHPEAPFMGLNMTALPDALLESELFGHVKGAFTGATTDHMGKFAAARIGTLLLDEIGDLSPSLQQKLLRVLQEREFVQVGGHAAIPLKARVIASTNVDLEEKVKQGAFREDLYYRLNVVRIVLPPLRNRKKDIPLLADHFTTKCAQVMSVPKPHLPSETIDHLMSYHWPGNVRELENLIASAMVISRGDSIRPENIPLEGQVDGLERQEIPILHESLKEARKLLIAEFEKKFIETRLSEAGGNVSRAASTAQVSRQIFHRLMQKYGIQAQRTS